MDLAKSSEIEYLKEKLALKDNEFFIINSLSGENVESLISHLITRYSENNE